MRSGLCWAYGLGAASGRARRSGFFGLFRAWQALNWMSQLPNGEGELLVSWTNTMHASRAGAPSQPCFGSAIISYLASFERGQIGARRGRRQKELQRLF